MKDTEDFEAPYFSTDFLNNPFYDKKYTIPELAHTIKVPKRIMLLPDEEPQKHQVNIRLAFSDLLTEQADFISSSSEGISELLQCNIHISSDQLEECTHIIVNTNSSGLCRRTYKYLAGLLLKKSIVSFLWYIDLFEASKSMGAADKSLEPLETLLEQLTVKNIVSGDIFYGYSKAPLIAHTNKHKTPALNRIDIHDVNNTLSTVEKNLIKSSGGSICTQLHKITKRTVLIKDKDDFYDMISLGAILTLQKKDKENSFTQ